MEKVSYALGLNIGQQLNQMGLSGVLNIEQFAAAIKDTLEGNDLQLPVAEAQQVLNKFFTELEAKQRAAAAEAASASAICWSTISIFALCSSRVAAK